MSNGILILGGYGNFGKRIAEQLVDRDVPVIINGRNKIQAAALADKLGPKASAACFDTQTALRDHLERISPLAVINTCGPFQQANYTVAEACIAKGIHYIDLADGRDFVNGIHALDQDAKKANVTILSGASSVPTLSAAVIDELAPQFTRIDHLTYGISPGHKTERGLATTQGIMSYVGKPLAPYPDSRKTSFGWQDTYRHRYPIIGKRWMSNCDIPDLDIFPSRYGLTSIRFSAGLELAPLHLGVWLLSWLIRWGLSLNLPAHSERLLRWSNLFNAWGSGDGGMHVGLEGTGTDGAFLRKEWTIIAQCGDGPYIPTIPAVLLAERFFKDEQMGVGARACVGEITLSDYLAALDGKAIQTFVT